MSSTMRWQDRVPLYWRVAARHWQQRLAGRTGTSLAQDYLRSLRENNVSATEVRLPHARMRVDPRDSIISEWLITRGCWEPFESGVVRKALRPGMRVLDVGAHAGYYSLLAGAAVGPGGKVHAFEPAPGNFRLLADNVALNRLTQVIKCNNAAVGAQAGEIDLHLAPENTGDHRIYSDPDWSASVSGPDGAATRDRVNVPMLTLDGYADSQGFRTVDVVKVDVQGAELGVFRGAMRLLAASENVVILSEFWPYGLRQAGTSAEELVHLLTGELGFQLFRLRPDKGDLAPISEERLLAETRESDPKEQIDVLVCRSREILAERGIL